MCYVDLQVIQNQSTYIKIGHSILLMSNDIPKLKINF